MLPSQLVNPLLPAIEAFLDVWNSLPPVLPWLCYAAIFLLFVRTLLRWIMGG